MNNPDFSKDPELVECAKAMMDAYLGHRNASWGDMSREMQNQWLREADAARTFFGAGYRLPEANHANAQRVAGAITSKHATALDFLRALNAAFPEQLPEPERCSRCGWPLAKSVDEGCVKGNCSQRPLLPCQHRSIDVSNGICTDCGAQAAIGTPEPEPAKPRDIIGDSERRKERQRMVWEAIQSLSGGTVRPEDGQITHIHPTDAVLLAVKYADAYLDWRDAEEAAAKERICKSK